MNHSAVTSQESTTDQFMGKRSYHVTIHSRLPGRLSQKLGVEGESSPSFLPIFYKIHSFFQCEISSFYSPDEVGAITDVQSDNIHIIYYPITSWADPDDLHLFNDVGQLIRNNPQL
jgi:hypothetical protein